MKDFVSINEREFISVKRASEITKYSKDYVGQLCREGKIAARMVGRTWFIDQESILNYKKSSDEAHESRIRQYSIERRSELSSYGQPHFIVSRDADAPSYPRSPTKTSSHAVPESLASAVTLSYDEDDRPLLPQLNKGFSLDATSHAAASTRRRAVSSEMHVTTRSETATRAQAKRASMTVPTLALAVVATIVVSAFGAYTYHLSAPAQRVTVADAQIASSGSVMGALEAVKNFVRGIFSRHPDTLAIADVDRSPPDSQGIAIVPSTYSRVQDELLKEKIRRSFSDEVDVVPDQSGTSGVVTPVFRESKGDSFVYVLVPVDERRE